VVAIWLPAQRRKGKGMPKVTKRSVDALVANWAIWDDELPGFGARRRQSGATYYFLKYRAGTRQRWHTIGRHGAPWTPEEARKEALRLLGDVVRGIDPGAARAADRQAATIEELCDLYLAEGVATKKPSTIRNDRSRIERHIKPLLGHRKIRELTRADVERFQRDVATGRTARDRKTGYRGRSIVTGGTGAARLSMILLSAISSFAVRRGLRSDNPCAGVRRYKPGKSERFLSAAEQVSLGEALAAAERAGTNANAIAVIRVLALTGARAGEILSLKWSEVDFERTCLRLSDSKTGAKVIPLGAAAMQVIAAQERREGTDYVFPGSHGGPLGSVGKVWRRVRAAAGLASVRLHDLRHSFASNIVNAGGSLPVIGALLGHRSTQTTARYAHLADDPLWAVADRAAGSIATAMKGGADADAKVVSIRPAGG
jgi:integrase